METANNGKGGYSCDICKTMLWEGKDGKDTKLNRVYSFNHTYKDIFETSSGKYKFCKECGPKQPKSRKREL